MSVYVCVGLWLIPKNIFAIINPEFKISILFWIWPLGAANSRRPNWLDNFY
jgi:hypothetical protein